MSLSRGPKAGQSADDAAPAIPVVPFDISRQYDIYCSLLGEERLYESVRLTGIRTLDKATEFSSGALGGFLEIEGANGARMLIPQHSIQMMCEHGTQPVYRVLTNWRPPHNNGDDDGESWKGD